MREDIINAALAEHIRLSDLFYHLDLLNKKDFDKLHADNWTKLEADLAEFDAAQVEE